MARSFALIVLSFITLVACDSPTAPRLLPAAVVTTYVAPGSGRPAIAASVAGDTVVVTGWIGVGEPCYEFSATASPRRDSLVVTLIAARLTNAICEQVVTAFSYVIKVRAVPTGTWQLHLVYLDGHTATGTQTAFDTLITVR